MSSIDPTDIPPSSNLPGPSVAWGRNRDAHILDLEKKVISLEQAQAGANRDRAASLANLSEQITDITTILESLVTALPIASGNLSDCSTLASPFSKTVVSKSLTVPTGYTKVLVSVAGNAAAKNTTAVSDYLNAFCTIQGHVVAGTTRRSAAIPAGSFGELQGLYSTYVVPALLTAGDLVTVTIELRSDLAAWSATPGPGAFLNGFALFYN